MPDLGEGTVEAEIVAWHTKPGDTVAEDQLIVEVMTDKAAVEVPAPVSGRVVSISGAPGDKIAVGSPLIVFEMATRATAPAAERGRAEPGAGLSSSAPGPRRPRARGCGHARLSAVAAPSRARRAAGRS